MKIILRNIMQVYILSKTELNYIIICYLPAKLKLKKRYLKDTILHIVKLLYSWAESENY